MTMMKSMTATNVLSSEAKARPLATEEALKAIGAAATTSIGAEKVSAEFDRATRAATEEISRNSTEEALKAIGAAAGRAVKKAFRAGVNEELAKILAARR